MAQSPIHKAASRRLTAIANGHQRGQQLTTCISDVNGGAHVYAATNELPLRAAVAALNWSARKPCGFRVPSLL